MGWLSALEILGQSARGWTFESRRWCRPFLAELVRGEERIKDTYFEPDEREHSGKLFFTIFKGLGVPLVPLLVGLVDQSIYLGE